MPVSQPRAASGPQDDLEVLRLAVSAHHLGASGGEDYPHIALLLTECFGDKLDELIELAWSTIEVDIPSVRTLDDDGILLAVVIDIAYKAFWLALTDGLQACMGPTSLPSGDGGRGCERNVTAV